MRVGVAAAIHQGGAGGHVQHSGRDEGLVSKQGLAVAAEGEEIEEHLQSPPVLHLRKVEGLLAGLIVHHTQVALSLVLPAVHPVHKAGQTQGNAVLLYLHGGQLLPAAEAQLQPHGDELGGGQLPGHAVHHREHRLLHAVKEPAEPGGLVLQALEHLGFIAVRRLLGQSPALLRGGVLAQHFLQHRMDKGAVVGGGELGPLPGLGLEAKPEKVAEVTGLVQVQPGGGHGHRLAVQGAHPLGGQAAAPPLSRLLEPLHPVPHVGQLGQHRPHLPHSSRRL